MSTTSTITDTVSRLAALPTANIADAQERLGVATGIRPIWAGARIAGPAYTVLTRPGDNKTLIAALDEARPGDVVVVDGGGDITRALLGDLIAARAARLGLGGFVVDGAVRDAETLAEIGLPVFARAVTPAGPFKHGPGRLQRPVAIGGVVVSPGDLVVGDGDGIVIVRAEEAEAVLTEAEAIRDREAGYRA